MANTRLTKKHKKALLKGRKEKTQARAARNLPRCPRCNKITSQNDVEAVRNTFWCTRCNSYAWGNGF